MAEIKLKPCPFCGGEAKLVTGVSESIPRRSKVFAMCEKCRAGSEIFTDEHCNGEHIFQAIEAWNMRADND